MTTTTTARFQVHALSAEVLDAVRSTGLDASGYPIEGHFRANAVSGASTPYWPAHASIEPRIPASPYREIGAVFAHA